MRLRIRTAGREEWQMGMDSRDKKVLALEERRHRVHFIKLPYPKTMDTDPTYKGPKSFGQKCPSTALLSGVYGQLSHVDTMFI